MQLPPAMPAPTEDAPFARRAVARVIDTVAVLLVFAASALVFGSLLAHDDLGFGAMILSLLVTFLAFVLHEVVPVAAWGRTLGKRLAGIAVVRDAGGGRPGYREAILRALLPAVLLVVFFPAYPVLFLASALLPERRGPHDHLAGTRVVRAVHR